MNELGKNLKRIRLLKNLSLKESGSILNMSATAVAKYEKGEIIPNSEKLIEFANAYNVKIIDILKSYNVPKLKFNSFRKKERLKGQTLELLEEIINNKVAEYLEVIELNDITSRTIKLKTYSCNNLEDAESSAENFRKDYNLSINQPIPDLINTLENLGIIVIEIDNNNGMFNDFDGLSEIVNNIPIIIVLKYNDGARQRFTIAHELGHLVLNIKNEKTDEEKLCNIFATSLLMPKKAVLNEFGNSRQNISYYELTAFKKEYKVSMTSIIYRLKELNIISEYLFRKIKMSFNTNKLNEKEIKEITPEETYQFNKLVHKLEVDNIISLNKACELLGLSINEYNEEDNNYRY